MIQAVIENKYSFNMQVLVKAMATFDRDRPRWVFGRSFRRVMRRAATASTDRAPANLRSCWLRKERYASVKLTRRGFAAAAMSVAAIGLQNR